MSERDKISKVCNIHYKYHITVRHSWRFDSSYLFFQGSDAEKRALWLEWFSAMQDKNATVRRETELSFKWVVTLG